MRWDAGALSPYRKLSPIFRYLSDVNTRPRRIRRWPRAWLKELGILLHTPGISWNWMVDNFNIEKNQLARVSRLTEQWHYLGEYNMLSAIETDGIVYMHNARPNSLIPPWVVPFILDDFKKGMSWNAIAEKWSVSLSTLSKLRKGVIGNAFHSGVQPRWRKNLVRRTS